MKLFSLKKEILTVEYKDGSKGKICVSEKSILNSLINKISSNSYTFMFLVLPLSILKGFVLSIYFKLKNH